jgi:O-antigen/teichoic acid export membrane protein
MKARSVQVLNNLFWKQLTSVFAGTLLAQTIPIFGSLIITRIFAPEAFGEFSTWFAIVSLLSVFVTLRLETVLPIIEDGQPRKKAVAIVLFFVLLVTLFIFFCLIFSDFFFDVRKFTIVRTSLFLLSVPAFALMAMNQIWQTWAATEGEYKKLNLMRITQSLILLTIQIFAGLQSSTADSLIVGFVLANCISFGVAVILMPKINVIKHVNLNECRGFFIRHKKFPIYALPADTINTAVAQLPVLVVFNRFGSEAAGCLALTMRVLGAPAGLVGKSVLDVFKRHAAQSIKEVGNCRVIYIKTFSILVAASFLMVLCTYFLAENIFQIAFGVDWTESGSIAILLLPYFALGLIASPLSYMSYLVEKPHIDLFWQIGLMIIVVVALNYFQTYEATLLGYGFSYAAMYLLYTYISYRFSCGNGK